MEEEVSFMDREVASERSPSQAAVQREAKRKPVFYTYMNPLAVCGGYVCFGFRFSWGCYTNASILMGAR